MDIKQDILRRIKLKVKIFERDDKEKLEEDINDFIDRKICTYLKIKKILI